jgi:hypothetical protein
VKLSTAHLQQLQGFEVWLAKHAGLLKRLSLQVDSSSSTDSFSSLPIGLAEGYQSCWLGTAALRSLLQTAAAGHIELQSLTLRGSKASIDLLQQLPALHVTELHAEVDLNCSSSMQALQRFLVCRTYSWMGQHTAACMNMTQLMQQKMRWHLWRPAYSSSHSCTLTQSRQRSCCSCRLSCSSCT